MLCQPVPDPHSFSLLFLPTSEVCVTERWVGSFITVMKNSLETVDREIICSPVLHEVCISNSQAHSVVSGGDPAVSDPIPYTSLSVPCDLI